MEWIKNKNGLPKRNSMDEIVVWVTISSFFSSFLLSFFSSDELDFDNKDESSLSSIWSDSSFELIYFLE